MDKIKELIQRPLITGIVGLVVGLIIGLPILGWGLWPVKWKDADAICARTSRINIFAWSWIPSK